MLKLKKFKSSGLLMITGLMLMLVAFAATVLTNKYTGVVQTKVETIEKEFPTIDSAEAWVRLTAIEHWQDSVTEAYVYGNIIPFPFTVDIKYDE